MIELYIGKKKVAQTRTNAQGNYTFRRKIKKRTRFGAQVLEIGRPRAAVPGSTVTAGAAGLQDGDDLVLRLQHRHRKTRR